MEVHHHPGRRALIAALALTLSLAPDGSALAQSSAVAPQAETQVFFEALDVNVVNIDVYVTDKQGKPVTDLKQSDFELFEDGKPVEITNFFAVTDGSPRIEPRPGTSAAPVDPALPQLPLASDRPDDQRLYLVLYFDNLFLRPFNRNKVIDHSRRFLLENVQDDDLMMLATFERTVHIRQPFTRDKSRFLDELDALRTLSAFAPQQNTERRDVIRRIDTSRDAIEARSHVDFYAASVFHDLQTSVNALKEIVGSLAGLPGRKAVLYVSDGIPMTAAEDLFFLIDEKYQDAATSQLAASSFRARRNFAELTALANANRVSFYTIEASGLKSHSSLSAEYGHRDTSLIAADVMRDSNREQPLMVMADATGGRAILNTNAFDQAFERIGEDLRNYYSLGYSPVHATLGRYYKIEVRVKRPGLEVRHRTGYRDKTPESRVGDGTRAALIHGAESNALGIDLRFGTERPSSDRRYLLPTLVTMPLGGVTFIPQGDNYHGVVQFSLGVIDEEGGLSPLHLESVPIVVPAAEIEIARSKDFTYEVELMVRPGLQGVAAGVRDTQSGDTSFIRKAIRVGR